MSIEATVERTQAGLGLRARYPWWMRAAPRRSMLVVLALLPLLTPVVAPVDDGNFAYPYCAATLLLSAWFCWQASRLHPEEMLRWQTAALAQCVHAVSYVVVTMGNLHWIPLDKGALVANACVAVSWLLFLPALMGVRAVRGTWVRALDYVLAAGTSALMIRAMSSGAQPNVGFSRVVVILLVVVFVAAAAFVARFASTRPEIKLFASVMSMYLSACLVTYFLLNIVNLCWVKEPYILASDLLIAIPELLLCEWAVSGKLPPVSRARGLTPALVDSLQPSIMVVGGVLLALYGFRGRPLVSGCAVVLIVVCYAVRTQFFYLRLFVQQTELRTQAIQMEELATRDPLTRVGNRRWFDEEAEKLLAASRSYPCSVVLVDTDKFKEINDTFGHPLGDEVLRAVAVALTEVTVHVKRGFCARVGGDEFGALWPGVDAAQALELGEMFRARVEAMELDAPLRVTVSLGIATTAEPRSLIKLMRWADSALYRAKAAGRNAVRGIDLGTLRDEVARDEDVGGK